LWTDMTTILSTVKWDIKLYSFTHLYKQFLRVNFGLLVRYEV